MLVSALVLVACGESSEEKYVKDFEPLNDQLGQLGEQVGADLARNPDEQTADTFGNYAKRIGSLQQRFDELEPPEGLADDQSRMIAAMGEVQGALEGVAGAAEQGNDAATRRAQEQLRRVAPGLRTTRARLSDEVARISRE